VRLMIGCSADRTLVYSKPFLQYISIASIPSTVAGTPTSGTFSIGETLTQATSGATGIIRYSSATSITINFITGTPDNSHTWTGGTSAAVFTPSALPVASLTAAQFQTEVLRWRAQLLHASVPPNMPAGGGLLAIDPLHKLCWGNDTCTYRGAAGEVKTDGTINAVNGFKVNGNSLALPNLADVSAASSSTVPALLSHRRRGSGSRKWCA